MTWETALTFVPDVIQIAVLYFAIYAILKAARGSRFGQVLMGTGIVFALLIAFTFLLNFDVLAYIVKTLLGYLALSTVVIFQPEIRRVLATIGALLFADNRRNTGLGPSGHVTPKDLVSYIFKLARARTGALIAIERGISLRGIETTGVSLDAIISNELLFSIFTEPMPLHDGGAIIRHGRLAAAHCLFPVSGNTESLFAAGMRHRAAVGLSEETDALVIVVSEERGLVSIAHNGRLIRYPDRSEDSRKAVLRWVRKAMPLQKTVGETIADWLDRRREKLARAATRRETVPASPDTAPIPLPPPDKRKCADDIPEAGNVKEPSK
jgi:diadenylate cyclase